MTGWRSCKGSLVTLESDSPELISNHSGHGSVPSRHNLPPVLASSAFAHFCTRYGLPKFTRGHGLGHTGEQEPMPV